MEIQKYINKLKRIDDPVKKRAYFTALLSDEIYAMTGQRPIVVGGEALEIYSQGNYTTGDIDLKAPLEALDKVLKELGFIKTKSYGNKDLDIFVEYQGAGLDEGPEAEKRTRLIPIEGKMVRVISIEDLMVDRLNAAKWWNDQDSKIWARFLYYLGRKLKDIDIDYLKKQAEKAEVSDKLYEIEESFKKKPLSETIDYLNSIKEGMNPSLG
jgi:hypothetical protein